jgi:hypothetical protein
LPKNGAARLSRYVLRPLNRRLHLEADWTHEIHAACPGPGAMFDATTRAELKLTGKPVLSKEKLYDNSQS